MLTSQMFSITHLPVHKLIIVVSILTLGACSTHKSQSPAVEIPSSITQLLDLSVCPKMHVSNKPDLVAMKRSSLACVKGVKLLVAPAPNACLSSGFGKRGRRQHQGIDYQSKPAGPVVAASDGIIVRVENRKKDYGNWLIIDHGAGIYTSYAHLANLDDKIVVGASITLGQTLGIMGNTGAAAKAIHLHYELRQGDISNPRSWWGLKAINPFKLPQSCI